VFANPGHPPDVLSSADVLRFLRISLAGQPSRGPRAAVDGRGPRRLVEVRALSLPLGQPGERATCERLTPIVRAYEAGRLKFRRDRGRSRRNPNGWEIIEP
jgi:hypothetical protein